MTNDSRNGDRSDSRAETGHTTDSKKEDLRKPVYAKFQLWLSSGLLVIAIITTAATLISVLNNTA